jgi:hypothetical protein
MHHSWVGSWPCPQTIDQAGKTWQGQTLKLITKIRKSRTKEFVVLLGFYLSNGVTDTLESSSILIYFIQVKGTYT